MVITKNVRYTQKQQLPTPKHMMDKSTSTMAESTQREQGDNSTY